MSEQLGAMLVRLRQSKGYSQLRVAEGLCGVSGTATITRHEVSRWERQERIPSAFWLRWLAEVLEVPMAELEVAATATRKGARDSAAARPAPGSAGAASGNGHAAALRPTRHRATQPASASQGRGYDGDPLSRVTIEFEHRTTSVRLSATYDDPRRAVSAIEAFPSMVGDGEPATAQPRVAPTAEPRHTATRVMRPAQGGAAETARQRAPQLRPSGSATAGLTTGRTARVPMGIRYKSEPEMGPATTGG